MMTKAFCDLNEEVRCGYTVSAAMKQVWNVEIDLLMKLLDVCRQNGLRCWVADGTLLGAVRHKGFIPWDNDIDVVMLRADYDRLLQLGAAFEAPYFLQSAYTDKRYFHAHAQLRNSSTAAIRPSDSYRPFNQGIFIDIFPLDAVPHDKARLQHTLKRIRRITRFLKSYDTPTILSGRIGLVFRKLKCRWTVRRKGWQPLFREVDDLLRATDISQCSHVAELSFSGDDFLHDKHLFDDTVMLDFEHVSVPAPRNYDAYLRTQYGDNYMTPLHVATAHDDAVLSIEQSYTELLPGVRRQYRHSALKRLWQKLIRK